MPQSQQAFSEPGLTTYSIQLVVATFPGVARQEHQLHDYFCKRTLILNANLQRKTDSEIHESDELLSHHQQLSCRLLEAPKARIFYVYGGPVRRWFEKAFNNKSIADERDHTTKYWAVHSVKIWDQRTMVFLPHPDYVQPWATQAVLSRVRELLEDICDQFGVGIDLAQMEAILWTRRSSRRAS